MTVDYFLYYKSSKRSRFSPKYLHLPIKMEDIFYSVLAKQSMFKCLTPLTWNKSGIIGILISTLLVIKQIWGLLPFENQIKSIGIILDVIYLTSTALRQRDFEGTGSNICLVDVGYVVILKVKWIILWLTEKWLSKYELSNHSQTFGNITRFIDLTKEH